MNVDRLSEQVRRDLSYVSEPAREWTIPRERDGCPVLDVLVVGAGQGGLATAFGLKRQQITNIKVVDRNPRGLEGPWRRFARMTSLRTPKAVNGIDLGIPSVTCRAWYEARFGCDAWNRIQKIPPDIWRDYLDWYRDVLELPVENDVNVTAIEPGAGCLVATLDRLGRTERVYARKIVLASGIDGNGRWQAPPALVRGLPATFMPTRPTTSTSVCCADERWVFWGPVRLHSTMPRPRWKPVPQALTCACGGRIFLASIR